MKLATNNPPRDRPSVARELIIVLRRRLPWIALLLLTAATLTITAMLRVEPVYRATTTLRLEDRTLPLGFDPMELQQYAEADVQARIERVLVEAELAEPVAVELDAPDSDLAPLSTRLLELIDRIRIGEIEAEITPPASGDLSKVSIEFTATVDDPDATAVERVMRAVQMRFLVDDRSSGSPAVTSVTGLAASGVEVDRLGQTIATLEAELESFERENAAGLPELYELNAQAMERADRERAQLDGQILTMEERRMDLDRALRDIERDAAQDRAGEEVNPLTSQRLVALQSEQALLTGLYGADHPDAQRLGTAIAELQNNAKERLDRVNNELREANVELARLERLYAIDHPDVVRLAHTVSALESRIDEVTLTGLTVGERRYIEGLASERRDIDGRLNELRFRQASLIESVADYESRALQGPLLEQRYRALQEELVKAKAGHEAARARREELAFEQRIAEQSSPGHLTVVEPVRVHGPLPLTRPAVVAALGAILGAIGIFLTVLMLERLDRRVSGARRIEELQGVRPLAEIPFIHLPGQATLAHTLTPGRQGALALLCVFSVLVLTGAILDEMGRVLIGILGL